MKSHIRAKLLGRVMLAAMLLGLGFGLLAHAFQGKKKAGDGSSLALLAAFRDEITDEITSDGSAYTHGVDGQVTLGRPDAGRFRMDLSKFNANNRSVNIDLSSCGADCDNLDGPFVGFLQSGSEFTRTMTAWTASGTALNLRTMRVADGVRYMQLQVDLTNGGRFLFSRPEHPTIAWQCNDGRAEPASVACTAESGGACVRWEIAGQNGCYRESLDQSGSAWSTTFVEDVGFQLTLYPAP